MKKSAIILSRFIQTSLAGALSILGFSSCGDQPDMYGTPVGHYEIKGTVTDPNGAPVKDAEIIVRTLDKNNISTLYPGATTDNNGDYTLKASGWPSRDLGQKRDRVYMGETLSETPHSGGYGSCSEYGHFP